VNKLTTIACLLAVVSVACVGNQVLADAIVLCPTAVTASGVGIDVHPYDFGRTIDNTALASAVNSGVAPTTWPVGNAAAVAGNQGRFSVPDATDTLVFSVPTSLAGYGPLTITGIALWQYDEVYLGNYYTNAGLASTTVYYHTVAGGWSATGEVVNFTQAAAQATTTMQPASLAGLPSGVDQIKFSGATHFDGVEWGVGFNEIRFTGTASLVPEPGTLVLLATCLVGLLCYAWRKRK
jgi:hypothetical protein